MATKSIRLSNGTDTLLPESAQSGSGYCKMADGTLMQWGYSIFPAQAVGNQYLSVTFPVAFTARPAVTVSPHDTLNFYTYMSNLTVSATSGYVTNGTTLWLYAKRLNASAAWGVSWIAVGRWK